MTGGSTSVGSVAVGVVGVVGGLVVVPGVLLLVSVGVGEAALSQPPSRHRHVSPVSAATARRMGSSPRVGAINAFKVGQPEDSG